MDNQQEQQKQELNQVQTTEQDLEWDDGPESNFGEAIAEPEEMLQHLNDGQKNTVDDDKTKKTRRPRKTIEQELAELDAKRQRLMEKKRRQDAYEKIVFGSTVIAMLKDMKEKNNKNWQDICKSILSFTITDQSKYEKIVRKIIYTIDAN